MTFQVQGSWSEIMPINHIHYNGGGGGAALDNREESKPKTLDADQKQRSWCIHQIYNNSFNLNEAICKGGRDPMTMKSASDDKYMVHSTQEQAKTADRKRNL